MQLTKMLTQMKNANENLFDDIVWRNRGGNWKLTESNNHAETEFILTIVTKHLFACVLPLYFPLSSHLALDFGFHSIFVSHQWRLLKFPLTFSGKIKVEDYNKTLTKTTKKINKKLQHTKWYWNYKNNCFTKRIT